MCNALPVVPTTTMKLYPAAAAGSGVLAVATPQGDYVAPPHYAVWIPPEVPHQVFNRGRTEMRSLYLENGAPGLPTACATR